MTKRFKRGCRLLLAMVLATGITVATAPAAVHANSDPAALVILRDQLIRMTPPGSTARVDGGIVVLGLPTSAPAALAKAISGQRVRVEHAAPVKPLRTNLYGGQGMRTTDMLCSTGFIVSSGSSNFVITAGHCVRSGYYWNRKGSYLGVSYDSGFYGEEGDFGLVLIKGVTWQPVGAVNTPTGPLTVNGWSSAFPGQQLCKMGTTTVKTCGEVVATEVSVNYGDVVLNGMIETNLCSDHGDSGGPLFTTGIQPEPDVTQAVGTLSGGNTSCGEEYNRTYFQPIEEVLTHYGVALGPVS